MQVCALHCSEYAFFGTQFGQEVSMRCKLCRRCDEASAPEICYSKPSFRWCPRAASSRVIIAALSVHEAASWRCHNLECVKPHLLPPSAFLSICVMSCAYYKCWCGAAGTDYTAYGPAVCDFSCTGDAGGSCVLLGSDLDTCRHVSTHTILRTI